MAKRILVAFDGSDHAQRALDVAAELALPADGTVHVLHVVPAEPLPEGFREWARAEGVPEDETGALYRMRSALGDRLTRQAAERLREAGVRSVETEVVEGRPAHAIVEAAKAMDADMLVLGSRGLGDAQALLLGSVSHKVMHLAPCTCVAVR